MLAVSTYQIPCESSSVWSRCCLGGVSVVDPDYCGATLHIPCDPRWTTLTQSNIAPMRELFKDIKLVKLPPTSPPVREKPIQNVSASVEYEEPFSPLQRQERRKVQKSSVASDDWPPEPLPEPEPDPVVPSPPPVRRAAEHSWPPEPGQELPKPSAPRRVSVSREAYDWPPECISFSSILRMNSDDWPPVAPEPKPQAKKESVPMSKQAWLCDY
eukprot:TRINITY_DN6685_c0_g1_i1.p1 TRINITY_DN6685_c0_g1~~TRINITY_DN6685_c0_g1_i1.p1  ORF type:complete len:214 (+),score=21.05 TRINITY_DN6685_c0_g1_i1:246-887(+)